MSAKLLASTVLLPALLALALGCAGLTGEAPAAEQPTASPLPPLSSDSPLLGRKGAGRRKGGDGGGAGEGGGGGGGGGGGAGGGGAEAPVGPSPAFRTFEADGGKYRITFTSTGVKKTWSNMSGPAVTGTWTHEPAEHHGSESETFVVRGECSLVRAVRVEKGGKAVEDPKDYVLDAPQCR